jgi:hypothetical protein
LIGEREEDSLIKIIHIPAAVEFISDQTFLDCMTDEISVDPANKQFAVE